MNRSRLLSVVCGQKMRDNRHNVKPERFRLVTKAFPMRKAQQCSRLPRVLMGASLLEVFKTQLQKVLSKLAWPHSWPCFEEKVWLKSSWGLFTRGLLTISQTDHTESLKKCVYQGMLSSCVWKKVKQTWHWCMHLHCWNNVYTTPFWVVTMAIHFNCERKEMFICWTIPFTGHTQKFWTLGAPYSLFKQVYKAW